MNITEKFRLTLLTHLASLRGKLEDELVRGTNTISFQAAQEYDREKREEIAVLARTIIALEYPLVNFVMNSEGDEE